MFFHMVYKSGQIFLPFCHNPRVWQTDRRTDRILIARPRLHSMQRGNNVMASIICAFYHQLNVAWNCHFGQNNNGFVSTKCVLLVDCGHHWADQIKSNSLNKKGLESLLQVAKTYENKQDAQLSQRDRAAGCVTVFAKSRRLELGDNILRTL